MSDDLVSACHDSMSAERLLVECCSEPQYDSKMIERVVIPTERRQLIRDLSKSYMKEDKDGNTTVQSPWNASTVKGKGGGLVFLLHGKPGIGKTYTASKWLFPAVCVPLGFNYRY